jgi:hypothetical protein
MAEKLDATFFALKRRDRAVLLPLTAIYVVVVVTIIALFTALNWGALQNMFGLMRSMPATLSEGESMSMVSGMFGIFGWLFLLLIPFYFATAAFEAACLRWMIRGEAPGLFGLTFDHDMWRVYGVYWVWFLALLVVNFAASLLMLPLMFVMMGDVMAQGGTTPNSAEMFELQLKVQSLSLLQYIPLAFIGIRFGPAAATSVARKEFSFFEAWKVTRDRFLPLLGSYALLWFLMAVAFAVSCAVFYSAMFGPLISDVIAAWPSLPETVFERYRDAFFTPSNMMLIGVAYLFNLALLLAYTVLSYGINARAVLAAIEEGKIEKAAA